MASDPTLSDTLNFRLSLTVSYRSRAEVVPGSRLRLISPLSAAAVAPIHNTGGGNLRRVGGWRKGGVSET